MPAGIVVVAAIDVAAAAVAAASAVGLAAPGAVVGGMLTAGSSSVAPVLALPEPTATGVAVLWLAAAAVAVFSAWTAAVAAEAVLDCPGTSVGVISVTGTEAEGAGAALALLVDGKKLPESPDEAGIVPGVLSAVVVGVSAVPDVATTGTALDKLCRGSEVDDEASVETAVAAAAAASVVVTSCTGVVSCTVFPLSVVAAVLLALAARLVEMNASVLGTVSAVALALCDCAKDTAAADAAAAAAAEVLASCMASEATGPIVDTDELLAPMADEVAPGVAACPATASGGAPLTVVVQPAVREDKEEKDEAVVKEEALVASKAPGIACWNQ